jgi:hypothetical protein
MRAVVALAVTGITPALVVTLLCGLNEPGLFTDAVAQTFTPSSAPPPDGLKP